MSRLTFGVCMVRDVVRDLEMIYVLGEAHDVFASPVVVGSDDSCEVVIDHPDVPARAAEFYPRGHHFYARTLPDGEASRSGRAVRCGPYEVAAYMTDHVALRAAVDLPVRFAARGLGASYAPAAATDPRTIEARRVHAAIANAANHARVADAALQQWCEDRIAIHFNSLTWASTPRPSLDHGRILYATHLADVLERYALGWTTVQARPFDRAAYAHVHRLDLWTLELEVSRRSEIAFATALFTQLPEQSPGPLRRIVEDIAMLHVVTLADDISPVRPLVALLERGIVPVALPDGTFVLYLSAAEPEISADLRAELDLVGTLPTDPHARGVYADFLEQRGDAKQAQRIRDGATPTTELANVNVRFDAAPVLAGDRPHRSYRPAEETKLARATEAPTATLEIEGEYHALHVATHLAADRDRVRIEPAAQYATIVRLADHTLWLFGTGDIVNCAVNGRDVWRDEAVPLYDGDAIRITASYMRTSGEVHTIDVTAILHDR